MNVTTSISDHLMSIEKMYKKTGLSRSAFFNLLKEGRGPRTFKIGRRRFCTPEAFDAWIKTLERGDA